MSRLERSIDLDGLVKASNIKSKLAQHQGLIATQAFNIYSHPIRYNVLVEVVLHDRLLSVPW